MGITWRITGLTGSGLTDKMKSAMDLGAMMTGLEVTFLHDTCSSLVPHIDITAGSSLTIVGMIQSAGDPHMWWVHMVTDTDAPEDPPIVLSVSELFEASDLHFVISSAGGIDLAKVWFSRYC